MSVSRFLIWLRGQCKFAFNSSPFSDHISLQVIVNISDLKEKSLSWFVQKKMEVESVFDNKEMGQLALGRAWRRPSF